ncbi:MAG: type II toxin-antitoxin system RatA family toxin [Lautropia sp.]|nr:type II toxin-antitoxin system RatA family toxin [Lautropia sp.]
MPIIRKSALVPYSADTMFDLVEQVENYPDFLPWCGGTTLLSRTSEGMSAAITISYRGIRQTFSTENRHERPSRIQLRLKDGPFSRLQGGWTFKALAEDACRIDLELDYEVGSGLIARVLGPVFGHIANTLVDAFVREAERRHRLLAGQTCPS